MTPTTRRAVRRAEILGNKHARLARQLPPDAPIVSFRGAFAFLSNFYTAPIDFSHVLEDGGVGVVATVPTVEHAYQASKAVLKVDFDFVLATLSPAIARRRGRQIVLRRDWAQAQISVMRGLIAQKFDRHPALAERLIATGDRELIESNTWGDRFWGATRIGPVVEGFPPLEIYLEPVIAAGGAWWRGENWHGRLLMERRQALREGRS